MWIMDPKHMSDAEKNGTALFPSQVGYFVNKIDKGNRNVIITKKLAIIWVTQYCNY